MEAQWVVFVATVSFFAGQMIERIVSAGRKEQDEHGNSHDCCQIGGDGANQEM